MTKLLPLLPLRDIVVFPGMVVPLFVGREKSVAALEAAMAGDKDIFLLAQLDPGCDDPDRDDLYDVGVSPASCSCSSCPTAPCACWSKGRARR
jgi:ATP-dependent Lon protease